MVYPRECPNCGHEYDGNMFGYVCPDCLFDISNYDEDELNELYNDPDEKPTEYDGDLPF
jgi:hypothetical protein